MRPVIPFIFMTLALSLSGASHAKDSSQSSSVTTQNITMTKPKPAVPEPPTCAVDRELYWNGSAWQCLTPPY